jgi:large subunit ribosomal protein LP1
MPPTNSEQAVSYAALILADDSIPITPEKLQTLLKAAGIEDVGPIWTTLFAKALEGKHVKDLVTEVGATGAAGGESPGGGEQDGKGEAVGSGDEDVCRDESSESGDEEGLGLGLFD